MLAEDFQQIALVDHSSDWSILRKNILNGELKNFYSMKQNKNNDKTACVIHGTMPSKVALFLLF